MANRAAFEIDLPVDELKSFVETYKAFKNQLEQQPDQWAAVGDSISDLLDPIDKIIGAVSGIGTASAASIQTSAAMAELMARRIKMTEEQTNLILAQRQDLEERIAKRKLDQQKKDEAAAKNQKSTFDIFATTATKSAKLFTGMDNATAKLFLNLRDGTTELLKWGGILTGVGSLIGGLLGAGSLYGLAHAASSVAATSKDARGMGVTYGEEKAFGVNYGQTLLDSPDSVLNQLNQAKHDFTIQRSLVALGVPTADINNKDAAQLAPETIKAIQDAYKKAGGNFQVLHALGIDQLGFSDQDIQRIGTADPKKLQSIENQYQKDIPAMDLPPAVQDSWTQFSTMLDRAKNVLETDFIKAITPLIPPLTTLSGDFVSLVSTLLQLPEIKQGITAFDGWLKDLNTYLKSDQFAKDLTTWEADFKSVLDGIKGIFDDFKKALDPGGVKGKWQGIPFVSPFVADDPKDQVKIPWYYDPPKQAVQQLFRNAPASGPPPTDSDPSAPALYQLQSYDTDGSPSQAPQIIQSSYDTGGYDNDNGAPWAVPRSWYPSSPYQSPQNSYGAPSGGAPGGFGGPDGFGSLESQYGLPQGFLARIRQVESGGNDRAVSSAGAEGAFQFEPGTAAQYGVSNPFDINQEAPAAAKMFSDLLTQFRGNLAEATAAYNWGAGNVQNDVSQHGADWQSYLPQETQNYLQKVLGMATAQNQGPRHATQVKIDVSNRTGGSAIITTKTIAA